MVAKITVPIGKVFGNWTVLGPDPNGRTPYWWTQCKCGRKQATQHRSLRNGSSTGCLRCKGGGTGWYVKEKGRLPVPGVDIPAAPRCKTCNESMQVIRNKNLSRGWIWQCKGCSSRITMRRYRELPEYREQIKANAIRRKCARYGLSVKQAVLIWEKQGKACAICSKQLPSPASCSKNSKDVHIDHCHGTGIVRGVLCSNCNRGLGYFKDSVVLFSAAIDYVNKSIIASPLDSGGSSHDEIPSRSSRR